MRGIRRAAATIGLLVTALLPVAAAVSPEAAPPADVPVAITQPIGTFAPFLPRGTTLPESGMTILVGSGLLGLAAILRKTTRHSDS
jgi:hypothetical protein